MNQIARTTPGSWEVLRKAIADKRKFVAWALRRSHNLIEKWVLPPPTKDSPDSSGEANPLDFTIALLKACERENAHEALDWLCGQFGGRFVPVDGGRGDGKLFRDLAEALPHLKALAAEIKKNEGRSDRVIDAHLRDAYVIVTSYLKDQEASK